MASIVGLTGVTIKLILCELTHPVEVNVTLYDVVIAGETTIDVVVKFPGDQLYDAAPLAVRVAEFPQIRIGGFEVIVILPQTIFPTNRSEEPRLVKVVVPNIVGLVLKVPQV